MKKTLGKHNIHRGVIVFAAPLLLIICMYLYLLNQHPFLVSVPSDSENINVKKYVEYTAEGFNNQRFVITFEHLEGKALEISRDDSCIYDNTGRYIETGYTIIVKERVFDPFGAAEYQDAVSFVYAYTEDTLPADFDFLIRVVYSDQTIEYSMREEGLFTR